MLKRPLILVALLYTGGVLLEEYVPLPLSWLLVLCFGLLMLSLFWSSARSRILWPLLALLGCANLALNTEIISPYDLRSSMGREARYLRLRGTLLESPTDRIIARDDKEIWRSLVPLEVDSQTVDSEWRPAYGRVLVFTPDLLDKNFFAGRNVEVIGVLHLPRGPKAEGLFDYRSYLQRQRIYYQLDAESTNAWKLLVDNSSSSASPPFADRFFAWAQITLKHGLPEEDEPLRLLWAMTLGWKTALTGEVTEPFMRSGTMHIFAISGLHIALIAGILVSLLRVMRLPRGACGVVVIPLIWLYTGATGWQPSAIRSTIMMTVVIGGWALNRPGDLLNSLAGSAFIILLWDPQQLFQASFQLSFFVVLSIALLMPVFEKYREALWKTDPFLPPELRPRWRRWLDTPIRYISTSVATSTAAWLGSLPLVAYYFHLVTPVSLLANLVIVPLSSFALMSNLGSLVCGNWFPAATELFNQSAWFWMRSMISLSEWMTTLPAAYFYVPALSILACLLYYAALFAVLNGRLLTPSRRPWACLLFGSILILGIRHWRAESSSTRLTILPLKGGHAVFVDAPGRENDWLIDCGDSNSAEFVVKPFLRAQGVNRLSHLWLTHGDLRHIGGMEIIDAAFHVREVFTSSARSRSPAYRQIIEQLKQVPERRRILNSPGQVGCWTILHPQARDQFSAADDNAVVLRGEVHGISVLLLSDLGRAGQNALLERHPNLRTEIVIAGLPGRGEPLGDGLLDAIKPNLVIIADSEYPASERAPPRLRERLANRGLCVVYLREAGTATLAFRDGKWDLRTMQDAF